MLNIHVGAAVLNLTPLAWEHNTRLILQALHDAREAGITLLCLPELCITGYGCQDAFHSPSVHRTAMDILMNDIAPRTRGLTAAVGLPLTWRNSIFNAVAVVSDGEVLGFVCKRFLAGDGVHYEPRWFKPWPTGAQNTLEVNGRTYPIGDLYFEIGHVKVGFEICEDAWVAQRPGSSMAGRGVDIILNPSASHFAFGKLETRKRFVIEGSRAFGVTYVYSNLLGCEEGRIIYDGGAMIATQGRLVAAGERLTMRDMELTHAVIDVEQTRMIQGWTSSFRPSFSEAPHECVHAPFAWPVIEPELDRTHTHTGWEASADLKEEEFWRAVTLGLFDYMRRSRSRGFVVSLSGGADSTICAVLVALMVKRGVSELGLDGVKARLGYDKRLKDCPDVDSLVRKLLVCAYQATRNSGSVTSNAAKVVAEGISAEFHSLDIDALVEGYVGLAEKALGRELTWQEDDVTLQNIQARVRAPSIWMFANIRGALLLTTSNRSEAAVGYTTMDGDSAGGLSPIGGVDKNFIRRWLRWLESDGPDGYGPLPAVRAVNVQQPTAELRPAEKAQTDEGDLMPYDLLDAIERAAIRDKQDPLETYRLMRIQFPQHDPKQLGLWLERFFLLWCRNQWKRERYAPSFHLDDKNLDPKTWCRFPILSSGFERELAELRGYVAEHYP
jgi:NAD+ synthase (glutamine-hydrolysing)